MNPTELKQTLDNGQPVFGMMISMMENMRWVSVLASTTLDYVVVDTEHGSRDRREIANHVVMGEAAGKTVIVRVPEPNPVWVAEAVDAGAHGVLVPYCEDIDEVRACAWKLRVHPLKGEATSQRLLAASRNSAKSAFTPFLMKPASVLCSTQRAPSSIAVLLVDTVCWWIITGLPAASLTSIIRFSASM